MSMFDGLTDVLRSVPPPNLSFSVDELIVLIMAIDSYIEKLKEDLDNPDFPVFAGYNGMNDLDICNSVRLKIVSYQFK